MVQRATPRPFWNLPLQSPPNQSRTQTRALPLPSRRLSGSWSHHVGATMAGKLIANLIVMGSTIIGRAMLQAYRKALDNANKIGVAHEAMNNIRRASKTMTEQEARQILGVFEQSTWEEIVQRYDNLFERNTKSGSFYLQSKVHRAKECLETVYQKNKQDGTPT
ncbi:mitochondrial import inner membrane translocase subunit PAM16 like 2-like isoform X1 [Phragmites australis]|uniref:mitochondrial import inner membrane translocase subunit PAM16 like 2-like isoform X1 n=2 Tax=Phragmites australis TaxID=29695 RepID=UPI002D78D0A2|nr:mitochondrial import inner membrane translocase subunit PAM16 like 2-like isoform X1 [Phragmites australis]XP_062200763.1 mitochondrial import inner membrane translocase subunit PAM16 like 2-like isoform X1 [Phragmites australis]